ncbi:MAG: tRNA lysidine(34) synthetase TilS [Rubrivivax sp.]
MSGLERVAVAASGGLDSTALLHCTARLARNFGVHVHALHVHHGLHPDADAWAAQVAAQCRRWGGISFHLSILQGRPARGDSVEAWARRERYRALARMAAEAGCGLVLLAQHRRDQAETVLLQALRGAGAAGLAAMPRVIERDGLLWARPWLDQPRERIAAYVARWRLRYVEDPANADPRYARSRLRQRLWPALLQAFPDAETALAAAARRAHEARAIADEVAQADALQVVDGGALLPAAWQRLPQARRANVLRHWLAAALPAPAPETLVQRLLHELGRAPTGEWPAGEARLRLHRGRLQVQPQHAVPLPAPSPPADARRAIDLSRPGQHRLAPWPGAIEVEPAAEGGVPAALLAACELRPRRGGEQFQAAARGLPRSLKKQFQAQGVPAWAREVPLLHDAEGRLLFVPGLGTDARALALPGQPRLRLRWVADAR